jgi:hypothetical protein
VMECTIDDSGSCRAAMARSMSQLPDKVYCMFVRTNT